MPRVNLFITCLADLIYPEIGERLVSLLERLGCEVSFPKAQTCCGQPQINSGYPDAARRLSDHFLEVFADTEGAIVAPFGSCVHAVCHQYPKLYAERPAETAVINQIAGRTYDFCDYIVNILDLSEVGGHYPHGEARIAYHQECHMARGLGKREEPLKLLAGVSGIEIVELEGDELCCGFGGSFSMKLPEISTAMTDEKIDYYKSAGVDTVVSTDVGCLMQIEGRARRRGEEINVMHLLELLEPDGSL